jgi:D-alanine-D-alanine ligase
VIVVAGGPSPEAEVSRVSAKGVAQALNAAGHSARILELDASFPRQLDRSSVDVVFPAVHGAFGEDGCLQGVLEILDLPYVGSTVAGSACAANKVIAKKLFRTAGLGVSEDCVCAIGDDVASVTDRAFAELGPGWVVKPANGGSAIGVRRVGASEPQDVLRRTIEETLSEDPLVLIEPLLAGLEVTCGVLEEVTGRPRALPPTWIKPQAADWYDFASKYASGGSQHLCPPPFAPGLILEIQDVAARAHSAVGARDLSRSDFIVSDDGENASVTLLEINTLPGMTSTSLFPEAAAAAGIPFPSLCDRLVRAAFQRGTRLGKGAPKALAIP